MRLWDMSNKENSNLVVFLTYLSSSVALQFGDLVPRDRSAAKGPLFHQGLTLVMELGPHKERENHDHHLWV